MRSRLSLAVAMTLATGCLSNHRLAPAPQRVPARDSLMSADASRSDSVAARGEVDGMMAWLAPDAVYLRGGLPVIYGRDQIREMLREAPLPAANTPAWQPLGAGISADHRSGFTFGVAARPIAAGAPAIHFERYIAFWKRMPGSAWKIVAYAEVGAGNAGPMSVREHEEHRAAPEAMPPPSSAAMRKVTLALAREDSNFAERSSISGTPAAFAAWMAPDGVTFAGSELVVGSRAERDLLESQRVALTWHPVYAGAAESGDLGFTVGMYVSTGRGPTGAAVQRFGKYLTVWRRQADGSWKFVVDGGNAAPTPSGGG